MQIVNADRVVPAWQSRQVGELLPSTPPDWLGLVDQPLGWRVRCFERDSVLALDQWGAFALIRIDPANTRFYIRTQGKPGIRASFIWSPLELLVFEPVHFIMQRRMMLGIKERAEAQAHEPCTAT